VEGEGLLANLTQLRHCQLCRRYFQTCWFNKENSLTDGMLGKGASRRVFCQLSCGTLLQGPTGNSGPQAGCHCTKVFQFRKRFPA